jgi:hypothetical protein
MERCDRITSLFWFIFGLYITISAYTFGIGSLSNPGPGFIFFLTGNFISILSIIVFVGAEISIKSGEIRPISWEGIRWGKMISVVISLVIYTYLFEKIGYMLSILFLMLYLFKGIEPQKWRTAITSTILTCVMVYVIFVLWLKCQFPRGLLPF